MTTKIFALISLFGVFQLSAQSTFVNNGSKLVVASGTVIVISGSLINNTDGDDAIKLSGELDVAGDFTNNAASGNLLTATSGQIVLNGSSTQSIGGSRSTYFNNLETNNSSGITINILTYIEGILTLSDGVIATASGNELSMLAGSSYSGGTDDSHVNGPMTKTGNTDFNFPVGDGGYIQQIGIADLVSTESFTAEYIRSAAPNNTNYSGNLTAVSAVEYWHITPASGSPQINLILTWNSGTFSGISDPSSLMLAHQKADGTWEDVPYISHTGTASNGTIKVGPITAYSNFTFGTDNNVDNPLPIELLSFDAIQKENFVELIWQTASETNNDFFTIEKSTNTKDWTILDTIDGAGNSNSVINYRTNDMEPFTGISYYRLRQTDFDGSYSYSVNRVVNFITDLSINPILYPNPTTNNVIITGIESPFNLKIFSASGKLIFNETKNTGQSIALGNYAKGLYFVLIEQEGLLYKCKIVKQ